MQPLIRAYRQIARRSKNWAVEARLRLTGVMSTADKTVVFLPWAGKSTGSSNLRSYEVAARLGHFGWRAVVLPPRMPLAQRLRILKAERPAAIIIQKTKNPLNDPALYADLGIPLIYDLDEADYLDPALREKCRSLCRMSTAVIAGSTTVAAWCRQYSDNVSVIWTGTPFKPHTTKSHSRRKPIVTWAVSRISDMPDEADFVLRLFAALASRSKSVRFRLYGLDGKPHSRSFVTRVRALGRPVELFKPMPYGKFLASLEDVAVGLNPLIDMGGIASGKSFGKLLGYFRSNVPAVASHNVDHPYFIRPGENGFIPITFEQWVDDVIALLNDPALRQRVADSAWSDAKERLSSHMSASLLNDVLQNINANAINASFVQTKTSRLLHG